MTIAPERQGRPTEEQGRPLVPSRREAHLGRAADRVDLACGPVVVAPPDPWAAFREQGGTVTPMRRVGRYFSSLDLRKINGPIVPAVVLIVLGVIGRFAEEMLFLALPDIQADLAIDLAAAFAVVGVFNIPLGALRTYMGHLADRHSRVWMLRIATTMRAAGLALTGLAGGLPTFASGSLLTNAAGAVQEPAGFTLFPDYYSVEDRMRIVFLIFQYTSIGGIFAYPVAGKLAGTFGWRSVFLGLAAVMFLVLLLLQTRLKEPVRGFYDRKALGASDEIAAVEQTPLSMGEAFRTAWSIRYLRVLCLIAPVTSIMALMTLPIQQTYLANEFGIGIEQRGYLSMITATAGAVGLLVLAPYVTRVAEDRPRVCVVLQAAQSLSVALLYPMLLLLDELWWAVAVLATMQLIGATVFPLTFGLQLKVVPARMRGFGTQVTQLFGALALLLLAGLFTGVQAHGYAVLFIAIGALSLGAAALTLTTLPHIDRDIRNALVSAMADEELRVQRETGQAAALLCRRVDVAYGGVQVLFGIDLEVRPGEIVALLGTNGAGKSTLLRAISGVQEPLGGSIFVDGVDVTHKPPHESARNGVVVVPGGRAVCHSLTVKENLRLAAWLHRADEEFVRARTEQALELFPRLRERLGARAGDLSGGEQQMLAIAQSYLMQPSLLMIDELSLGLAPQVVESLLDSLRAINGAGTTILLVEQSLNVALTIADRAVYMEKGEIRFDGSTRDLLSRPDLIRSVFIGGASKGGRVKRRPPPPQALDSLLEVENVTVSFGAVRALTDVSLAVRPREIVGVIGPNGAGKTTLFDAISGLARVDSGRVVLAGQDVTKAGLDARAALGLGRSFQNARLFPAMTVRENLAVSMQRRIRSRNPLLAAVWAPPVREAERQAKERIDDVIELLGLGAFADKFVGELSTGSRRAVDVGCIMLSSPDLLLLDEPSSGLAQAETEALGPVIQRIVRETGCGVIVIEHDLPLVTSVSDRLVAMELGRVIATGSPDDVLADREVKRAYLSASREVMLRSDSGLGAALAAAGLTDEEQVP